MRLPNGATNGYVLTSDASGNATWKVASAGGGGSQVPQLYTVTAGYTKDRTFNPTVTTMNEIAGVLGTLIDDLKTANIIVAP